MIKRKQNLSIKWMIIFALAFPLISCGQNSHKTQQNQNSNQDKGTIQDTTSNPNNNRGMMGGGMMNGGMRQHGMMGNNKRGKSKTNSNVSADTNSANEWIAPSSADKLKNPLAGIVKASKESKELFGQDCAPCHGNTGKGDGPTADMLEPKPANLNSKAVQKQSDGAIFWKISTGKNDMPSFKKTLTEKQRWEIINYIRTLAKANK